MRRRLWLIASGLLLALSLAAPASAQVRTLSRTQDVTPQALVQFLARDAGTWEAVPGQLTARTLSADQKRTGVTQTTRTIFGDGGEFRSEVIVTHLRRSRVTAVRTGTYSVSSLGGNRFSLVVQLNPDPNEERLIASRAGAGPNTEFASRARERARAALRLEATVTALDDGRLDLGDGSFLVRR